MLELVKIKHLLGSSIIHSYLLLTPVHLHSDKENVGTFNTIEKCSEEKNQVSPYHKVFLLPLCQCFFFFFFFSKIRSSSPRLSRSQGSTPSKGLSMAFTLSPGTRKIMRNSPKAVRKRKRSTIRRANSTVERILQYQELGKDVPTDIAIKRVLVLAQRGDWSGCEQALRAVERADQAEQPQPLPLAHLVDSASGNTPLMYAAMENKISLMERMITLGCSLKRENIVRI